MGTGKIVELLAPAKDYAHGCAAIDCGADALYVGAPAFGARAGAAVPADEIGRLCDYAHRFGAKVFVTMNTLVYESELSEAERIARDMYRAGADALIVQDAAFLRMDLPPIELHASTQMFNMDPVRARFWYEAGFTRLIVERAASLDEMRRIAGAAPGLEIEAFVHGAICVCYSGRCFMSRSMGPRSGNRGECAQPCRWKYNLVEEHRPGQYMEIGENEDNGSYILNANDLCTAPFIDLICKAGVDSLKIEGRAKTFYYVASVTSAYRRALDAYLRDPYNDNFELPDDVIEELSRTSHRHYSPGFYFGKEQAQQTPSHTYVRDWDFIGTVDGWDKGVAHCTQRGKFNLGDAIEVLQPDGSVVTLTPEWIENAEGERVDATPHPMMQYTIPCATPLMPYSLLRMRKPE